RGADRIVGVAAAGLGRDRMIHRRKRQIRPAHRPLLLLQRLKGVRGMKLVQDVAGDIEQIATICALADKMAIPNLCKKRFWHGPSWSPVLANASWHSHAAAA